MDFRWAIKQLKAGRAVRRACWGDSKALYINSNGDVRYLGLFSMLDEVNFTASQMVATDWELYHDSSDNSQHPLLPEAKASSTENGSVIGSADRAHTNQDTTIIDLPLSVTPSQFQRILKIANEKPTKRKVKVRRKK